MKNLELNHFRIQLEVKTRKRGPNTHTLTLNHEQVACSHLVAISGNKVTYMWTFSGTAGTMSPAATALITAAWDQRSDEWCLLETKGR